MLSGTSCKSEKKLCYCSWTVVMEEGSWGVGGEMGGGIHYTGKVSQMIPAQWLELSSKI